MNDENMLTVLMYLFKYHMTENCHIAEHPKELSAQLEALGFEKDDIELAFNWIENLIQQSDSTIETPQPDSLRVLAPHEQSLLNLEAQEFLLTLEKQEILSPYTREIVINQLISLDTNEIDIGIIQWVTLMVLFHQEDQAKALAHMEFLVLEDSTEIIQ